MGFRSFLIENSRWLAAGVLLTFLSSFGQTFFISIFAGELRGIFGLSNGAWGGIYTLGTALAAGLMLLAGGLADRFRVSHLGAAVLCLLAIACFAMALNRSVLLLPVVILALRFAGQGMASHVALVGMARWFVATRGRAIAVATLGFSIGEATMPLTFVALKRAFDWHQLWLAAGLLCLAVIPLLLVLLRRERTPQNTPEADHSPGMDGRHWTRAEALGHPLFWALVPALLSFPAFVTAFWFHQVHFATIKGWDHLSLVAVFPFGTASFILSTALFGWAIDRFGTARLLPIYLLPLALGFVLHWYAPTVGYSAAGVMLMGLSGGGQATLPAACWAEFFGTRYIGAIKSTVTSVMVLGSAIGPGLSGWLIDIGYAMPIQLLVYAGVFLVSSAVMVLPLARLRSAAAA
jgi:MFS family permease